MPPNRLAIGDWRLHEQRKRIMKTRLLLALTCCMCVWAEARAQTQPAGEPASGPTSGPASTQPVDLGVYAPMADECGLNDEQKSRIARKVAAMRELEAEEKKQSAQIVEKLAAAYQEKDNEQATRLRKEMGYLRDAARKVSESLQADVLAVLTPAQRVAWETAQLQRRATARYRQLKFDLTDLQRARLRQACQEQGQNLAEQTKLPSEARMRSAMSDIDRQVLTADQRRQASMVD